MNVAVEAPILLADVKAFFDLLYESIFKPMNMPREAMFDNWALVNAGKKLVIKEKATGKVIATGAFYLITPEEAYVSYIAVDQAYRRLGVGRLMMEQLERLATKRGAKICTLNARMEAVAFYKRLQYQSVEEREYGFGASRHTVCHMRKSLCSPKL